MSRAAATYTHCAEPIRPPSTRESPVPCHVLTVPWLHVGARRAGLLCCMGDIIAERTFPAR
jgi:hypothetical protein